MDGLRKQIEKDMTEEDKKTEQEMQQEQLAKIFSLLKEHESTFGKTSEEEFQRQLKMYQWYIEFPLRTLYVCKIHMCTRIK